MKIFAPTLFAIACLWATSGAAQTFGGYPCTVDCSGHEAGYDWALENGISDGSQCSGNSNSFIEGCMAAAEEATEAQVDEDNSENDPELEY